MRYEYEILKVGDADVIFIRHYIKDIPYVVLIDAGNISDWKKIKDHLTKYYGTHNIDLAIGPHPDNDHMGGFFGLLDDDITISEFWLIDPAKYLTQDDIKYYRTEDGAMNTVRQIFNKPNDDSQNLIDILIGQQINAKTVIAGTKHSKVPIKVVGPTADYYGEVVKNMVKDYRVKVYEEADTTEYDEAEQISVDTAKSSIDTCDDDQSPYNQSSIILLYEPEDGKKILFTGDATCASLIKMIEEYPDIKDIDLLKVPHHGSKHNLSSVIIDTLKPKTSYISAKGTRKHPSSAIVNYLSKYGNVYSTHKCNGFIHRSQGIDRANTKSLEALKLKQQ
jgi:beta-lactamase superfamily II metal-dependent hydrolase